MQYVFGDSDLAAQRLGLLADIFAEPTTAFLTEAVAEKPRLALDLGCGPGHTTHLLAELLGCGRVIGLDVSEHFIELAGKTATESVSFRLHDVTQTPFPVAPGERIDLIYCRYLLSHLDDPQALIAKWGEQLTPGGLLLAEENESINTTNSVFRFYLEIVEDMMDDRAARLYVGSVLDRMKDSETLKKRSSRARPHQAPTHSVAAMFYVNIQTWRHDPFVTKNYTTATIDELESDLQHLTARSTPEIEIEWSLRQIVFERV